MSRMANRHDVEEEKEGKGEDEGANERCAPPLRGRVVQPFSDTCRRLKYINGFILSLFSGFSTRHQLTVLLHVSHPNSPPPHTPRPFGWCLLCSRASLRWASLPLYLIGPALGARVATCACHYETLPHLLTFPFPDYTFHLASSQAKLISADIPIPPR